MAKTIAKLYANGNFETVGTPLVQSGVTGNYKFTETGIIVPKIIEYPPTGYRNYFIERTSVSGYLQNGNVNGADEYDRTSDFIDVSDWGNGVTRIWYEDIVAEYNVWVGMAYYNASKQFLSMRLDDTIAQSGAVRDLIYTHTFPANVAYIRISTNHYDHPTTSVKISVEKGTVASNKHYLAFEDMPAWVRDTGRPISIFLEGVIIKGELTQS